MMQRLFSSTGTAQCALGDIPGRMSVIYVLLHQEAFFPVAKGRLRKDHDDCHPGGFRTWEEMTNLAMLTLLRPSK